MKARELMRRDLTSVEPDTPVSEVIYLMEQAGLSAIPVLDDEGVLVGVISERDIIRAALPGYLEMLHSASFLPNLNQLSKRLKEMAPEPVSKYMNPDVIFVHPDDEDLQIADTLIRNELKQLPVVDDQGHLVGVIRRIDLLYRLS
jgi:CBS domain-containing protein